MGPRTLWVPHLATLMPVSYVNRDHEESRSIRSRSTALMIAVTHEKACRKINEIQIVRHEPIH